MKSQSKIWRAAIVLICFVAAGIAAWQFFAPKKQLPVRPVEPEPTIQTENNTVAPQAEIKSGAPAVIGYSVQKRQIVAYNFGSGKKRLVFVGGIHGGYEWNGVLLAYELIDYLENNPQDIPSDIAVSVIPDANPDGTFAAIGKVGSFSANEVPAGAHENGRLNANAVDLNRNFACNWKAQGTWRQKPVSGGTAAFSEPESAAIRDYITKEKPAAVVFWHSQSNAIYGSMCGGSMLAETEAIMAAYSKASGYKTMATFDQYAVTGDASDWLASIGIPAMTVELATHKATEWERNFAGIKSLFEYYSAGK